MDPILGAICTLATCALPIWIGLFVSELDRQKEERWEERWKLRKKMSDRVCVMMVTYPDPDSNVDPPECGKPARRIMPGKVTDGICDACFEAMIAGGDFTREEMERQHPLETP